MVTAGKPAFVLMQNSGLGNALNPITSMLYIYRMPVFCSCRIAVSPAANPTSRSTR